MNCDVRVAVHVVGILNSLLRGRRTLVGKFLIRHSLFLSLDKELADLSLPLAFSPHL